MAFSVFLKTLETLNINKKVLVKILLWNFSESSFKSISKTYKF